MECFTRLCSANASWDASKEVSGIVNDFPKLRPGLRPYASEEPDYFILVDEFRIGRPILILRALLPILRLLDGEKSLADIAGILKVSGIPIPQEALRKLIVTLDESHFLESPRLQAYFDHPDRQPSCIGCYDADPVELRAQLSKLFTDEGGPGLPAVGSRIGEGPLRGVLVPHIDYARGGVTYGWGFKELIERTDASLFVIIGTSHYSGNRFSLTRKNFLSPLGRVPTDQEYIDRLVEFHGDGLFDDPYAHIPEHSIELEVVLLQYLLEGVRPFRIVPLLVGSFVDTVYTGQAPESFDEVGRMIAALRIIEAEWNEPICYIISGDLAHIGPKFRDPDPVAEPFLSHSYSQDHGLLKQSELASADGYFRVIAEEKDARRICGFPPTYTFLKAIAPRQGQLLHYGRYVEPKGFESVSFASVAFY
jgi:AmmeMemoRadiSam system protein B